MIFEASAFEDFSDWATQDKKIYAKIVTLITDIQRSPFSGLGKPEPLVMNWPDFGPDVSIGSIV